MLASLRYSLLILRRHPAYTLATSVSLALAVACCLLLYWFVRFHESFDTYHPHASRIYRLVTELHYGPVSYDVGIPAPVGAALRQAVPGLPAVAMSVAQENQLVQVLGSAGQSQAQYPEPQAVAAVEPAYFSILAYRWLAGTPAQALRQPFSVALTRRLAHKYFGTTNPLGRHLRLNNQLDLTVTGLLDDIPPTTDQRYEFFISYATLRYYTYHGIDLADWQGVSSPVQGWVLLPPGVTQSQFAGVLLALHQARYPATLRTQHYQLLPLREAHFSPYYGGVISRATLRVLTSIGVLLLLTAGVNFINLATAQVLGRGREVGVRRALGATQARIFWQFISETSGLVLAAAGVGLVLAYTALPFLRVWTDTPIPLALDGAAWLFLACLVTALTLGAGWYPGRVLAGYRPAQVLKGQAPALAAGGLWVRRALVVVQLALSQGFLLSVLVIYQQLAGWLHTSPGFDTTGRVMLPLEAITSPRLAQLRLALTQVPGVAGVSFCEDAPTISSLTTNLFTYDNRPQPELFMLARLPVDASYAALFKVALVAGQGLPASDTLRGFLLNETAVRQLGVGSAHQVLGRQIRLERTAQPLVGPVLGVVRDWRHRGFREAPIPLALYTNAVAYRAIALQLAASCHDSLPPAATLIWHRFFPGKTLVINHVSREAASLYEREQQQLNLVRLAAFTAIAISSLGLTSLLGFLAQRRTREVGIRKVLGARPRHLLAFFGWEFAGLLAFAFVLAAPPASWLMHHWLQQYNVHIGLQPWVFLATLSSTFVLTLVPVGYTVLRTTQLSAVQALRTN